MKSSTDPSVHRDAERRFVEHVDRLLDDERLRVQTSRGRKPITSFARRITRKEKSGDVKRLMIDLRIYDRDLQARMPAGHATDVELTQKKWWFFNETVGRVRALTVSPNRDLLRSEPPQPLVAADVTRMLAESPTGTTLVLLSTSGFEPAARDLVKRGRGGGRTL